MDGRCAKMFPKYWTESHFLMGNNLYVYKKYDFYDEAQYHKKQLINFISSLRYFVGGTPMEEVENKRLQRLIDVRF